MKCQISANKCYCLCCNNILSANASSLSRLSSPALSEENFKGIAVKKRKEKLTEGTLPLGRVLCSTLTGILVGQLIHSSSAYAGFDRQTAEYDQEMQRLLLREYRAEQSL